MLSQRTNSSLNAYLFGLLLYLVCFTAGSPRLLDSNNETRSSKASALNERDDFLAARIPYILPPPGTDPIADAIRARRGNGTLLALDGILLNAPLIAQVWNSQFSVIRSNTTLPGKMRELVILRTATLNNVAYEWLQHEAVGRAEGLTTAQLKVIRFTPSLAQVPVQLADPLARAKLKQTLGPDLAAALEFTDWNTQAVRVPDEVFKKTREALGYDNRKIVELVATCGGYNFVSRFIISLNIDGKNNIPVPIPQ